MEATVATPSRESWYSARACSRPTRATMVSSSCAKPAETKPPFLPDAPSATRPASSTTTSWLRASSARAVQRPARPPPTIYTPVSTSVPRGGGGGGGGGRRGGETKSGGGGCGGGRKKICRLRAPC